MFRGFQAWHLIVSAMFFAIAVFAMVTFSLLHLSLRVFAYYIITTLHFYFLRGTNNPLSFKYWE